MRGRDASPAPPASRRTGLDGPARRLDSRHSTGSPGSSLPSALAKNRAIRSHYEGLHTRQSFACYGSSNRGDRRPSSAAHEDARLEPRQQVAQALKDKARANKAARERPHKAPRPPKTDGTAQDPRRRTRCRTSARARRRRRPRRRRRGEEGSREAQGRGEASAGADAAGRPPARRV